MSRLPYMTGMLFLATSCADYALESGQGMDDVNEYHSEPESDTASDTRGMLRVDVTPPSNPEDETLAGLLPQTFSEVPLDEYTELELLTPVTLEGTVSAYAVSPWFSSPMPPGEEVLVASAEVALRSNNTVHSSYGRTDDDGDFMLRVVPDLGFRLSVVPQEDFLPLYSGSFPVVEDSEVVLDLGYGASVWGFVLDEDGTPVEDANVMLEAEDGTLSNPVATSAQGFYNLRGAAGESYAIVVEGPVSGTVFTDSPLVVSDSFELDATGSQVDLTYPAMRRASLNGRVEFLDGSAAEDIVVRIRSVSLDDYGLGTLNLTTDTDRNGRYSVWVVPGTYEVSLVSADANAPVTPAWASEKRTITLDEDDDVTIETVLQDYVDILGQVQDPTGAAVAEALVSCTESDFSERTFTVLADEAGVFSLNGPATQMDCIVTPTGSATSNLAITRTTIDPSVQTDPVLVLVPGYEIAGAVVHDGAPVPFATVTIRDASDEVWAVALTDEDGEFAVNVAVSER